MGLIAHSVKTLPTSKGKDAAFLTKGFHKYVNSTQLVKSYHEAFMPRIFGYAEHLRFSKTKYNKYLPGKNSTEPSRCVHIYMQIWPLG